MFYKRKVKFCIICGLFLSPFFSFSQLLTQNQVFTHIDSLRGTISPIRASFDVHYYDLEVAFDTLTKSIKGKNTIHFNVLNKTNKIQLDLDERLKINSILYKNKAVQYSREHHTVYVDLPISLDSGRAARVTVEYSGKPIQAKRAPWDGGFVWSEDKNGNAWIAVACEGLGASSWWPCKDHLSDEPDSMRMTYIVPKGMKAIGNGQLKDEKDINDKQTAFTWFVSNPINSYNVTFNIGQYVHWSDTFTYSDKSKLALNYYVMPYNLERSKTHFEQVKPMLSCYEKYLGKYPFMKDGYALVETPYLGMEHQSAIAYGNKYKTGYNGSDYSGIGLDFDYIIIHETGHEWWGNSVSCNDIADMWIHEGFCTYSEAVYVECMQGYDKAQDYINYKKRYVQNKEPIQGPYGVNEEGHGDMYNKGMLMLNTLRTVINNDPLWWNIIKNISDTVFYHKNIDAQDVIDYFELRTKKDLKPFFKQYLQHAEIPTLSYVLKPISKTSFKFEYLWKDVVEGFDMPIVFHDGKKYRRLAAGTDIKSKKIRLKSKSDFKIADNLLYINTLRQF
jgi:aminopeptidase N